MPVSEPLRIIPLAGFGTSLIVIVPGMVDDTIVATCLSRRIGLCPRNRASRLSVTDKI